jgi:DUF4097 and DUF4098 domain-containing protein YvlB
MLTVLLTGLLVISPMPADTVVSVRRGDLIVIENFSGDLDVRTWDRSEVSIEFQERRGAPIDIERTGGRIQVTASDRKGRDRNRSYIVSVPAWLDVEIRGRELNVRVEGLEAGLDVTTREGDISVRDHTGEVVARTLDGFLEVRRSSGRFDLTSLDDDVSLFDVQGDVYVDANDGDIELVDVDAETLSANTVDGHIEFSGMIHPDGEYEFVTHDGDIVFAVPGDVEADVSVSTYDGELETDFPIMLQRLESGRELNFALGGGGARVRLQAFDGAIRLRRTSSTTPNR